MVTALINPMGTPDGMPIQEAYKQDAFFKGFTEGYNTMDALASLAFGIIVIHTLHNLGLKNPKDVAYGIIKSRYCCINTYGHYI